MKDTLQAGLTHQQVLAVTSDLTVPQISTRLTAFGDMPPVFATAMMVGFIEASCIELLAPHLDDGEHSVGTHVDVSHVSATPVGLNVTARVEIIDLQGRSLTFRVSASDDKGLIGEGIHKRMIIKTDRFMAFVNAKGAG